MSPMTGRSHGHFQSRPSNRRRAVYRRRSSSRAIAPPVFQLMQSVSACFYKLTERASEAAAGRLCLYSCSHLAATEGAQKKSRSSDALSNPNTDTRLITWVLAVTSH